MAVPGTMVAASAPPACRFQFQVVCQADSTFGLVNAESMTLNASATVFNVGRLSPTATINILSISASPLPFELSSFDASSDAATCTALACGCGQCSADASFSSEFGYDLAQAVSFPDQVSATLFDPPGYTLPNYLFSGSEFELPCKRGFRAGTHAPAGPRSAIVVCEAQTWTAGAAQATTPVVDANVTAVTESEESVTTETYAETTAVFGSEALASSSTPGPEESATETFNCGIEEPAMCLPVTCGTFQVSARDLLRARS
eukprot:615652-Rhodomonas_salina.2